MSNKCVVSATVRAREGAVLAGALISIVSCLVDGTEDSSYYLKDTSDASGEVSFDLPQGAVVKFSSNTVSEINNKKLTVPNAITFFMGVFFADNASEVVSASSVGAAAGTGVTAVESGNDVMHRTVLQLVNTPVTVGNTTGASFGSQKVYDFPIGRLLLVGGRVNLSLDWSDSDIVATGSGDASLGTTATADATLNSTEVDLMASTAMLDPFVDGVGSLIGNLVKTTEFDGTSSAKDMILNMIIDDADVEDAASATVYVTGTIEFLWAIVGT